jgi:acetyl-CoA carboxylase biotin carboxyl carrier protein
MPTKFDLDTDFVRRLAKLLEETGLSEIEYADGDKRIRCAIAHGPVGQTAAMLMAATPGTPSVEPKPLPTGTPISSPMVGTAYLASSPGTAPYVKVGDTVKEGDTLLIIEAMKVMNPIKASQGGTVVEILIADATPVEFGEVLLVIV